jgi:hypothetical protein
VAGYLAWVCSKFFPGWRPFGDASILGWGLVVSSPTLALLLRAYLKDRVIDPTPRCDRCDYNLTGNESGRCPECGTSVLHLL